MQYFVIGILPVHSRYDHELPRQQTLHILPHIGVVVSQQHRSALRRYIRQTFFSDTTSSETSGATGGATTRGTTRVTRVTNPATSRTTTLAATRDTSTV
ncbi:MAG: hypothetical protein JST42_04505, partial [Bacteroidetes bacterium]|nr:hypothetical protein [Bacteroidota bacterium]